jgi:hypothetical protein
MQWFRVEVALQRPSRDYLSAGLLEVTEPDEISVGVTTGFLCEFSPCRR